MSPTSKNTTSKQKLMSETEDDRRGNTFLSDQIENEEEQNPVQ